MQSNFVEITLRHGCSPVNLLHIFRAAFPRNTSGWLILFIDIFTVFCSVSLSQLMINQVHFFHMFVFILFE